MILTRFIQEPQEPQTEKVTTEPTHEEQMQNQLAEQLQLPALAASSGMASAAPPPQALGAQVRILLL